MPPAQDPRWTWLDQVGLSFDGSVWGGPIWFQEAPVEPETQQKTRNGYIMPRPRHSCVFLWSLLQDFVQQQENRFSSRISTQTCRMSAKAPAGNHRIGPRAERPEPLHNKPSVSSLASLAAVIRAEKSLGCFAHRTDALFMTIYIYIKKMLVSSAHLAEVPLFFLLSVLSPIASAAAFRPAGCVT